MEMAPAGDRGLLVTLPDASAATLRAAADRVRELPGIERCVIGHESVLVIGAIDRDAIRDVVASARETSAAPARVHRVDVSFAGDYALDLPEFLARVGSSKSEFLARVRDVRLTVRYLGFRPGWAYCDGWPEAWAMPRRPTSRNRVPRGSLGIAGTMAGFYPDDCPGGWNILGRTGDPPDLEPGDAIEIVPNEQPVVTSPRTPQQQPLPPEILRPGQLTAVVRVPFDAEAAALANRAVGNADDAPILECVLVGPRVKTNRRAAWCGAGLKVRELTGEFDIGRIQGFRGWLAFGDGNRATRQPGNPDRGDRLTLRVIPGPHVHDLPTTWQVTNQLDRVGIRLRPLQTIDIAIPANLPSIGVQFGTLQWHPDGSLVAMGPDHPVTGGYLQPATVITADLWKLGQLAPGETVSLLAV